MGGVLLVFASTAGALVDLAADLAFATKTDLSSFPLDAHLDPSARQTGMSTSGFSIVHQAIGVLIADGNTPEQARARLEKIAGGADHTLTLTAVGVLNGFRRDVPPPSSGPADQAA